MPDFAHLEAELRCPSCDLLFSDWVFFQWGFCPGVSPRDESIYHVGDHMRWRKCNNRSILAWVAFGDEEKTFGANIGDPAIKNLLVRDWYQFYWEDPDQRRRCLACNEVLEGAIVEIRENVIRQARIYLPGEFDNNVEVSIIQPDGNLKPMPEWEEHPLGLVRLDC